MKANNPLEDLLSELAEIETYGWPPDCCGLLYQPERPQIIEDLRQHNSKTENHSFIPRKK